MSDSDLVDHKLKYEQEREKRWETAESLMEATRANGALIQENATLRIRVAELENQLKSATPLTRRERSVSVVSQGSSSRRRSVSTPFVSSSSVDTFNKSVSDAQDWIRPVATDEQRNNPLYRQPKDWTKAVKPRVLDPSTNLAYTPQQWTNWGLLRNQAASSILDVNIMWSAQKLEDVEFAVKLLEKEIPIFQQCEPSTTSVGIGAKGSEVQGGWMAWSFLKAGFNELARTPRDRAASSGKVKAEEQEEEKEKEPSDDEGSDSEEEAAKEKETGGVGKDSKGKGKGKEILIERGGDSFITPAAPSKVPTKANRSVLQKKLSVVEEDEDQPGKDSVEGDVFITPSLTSRTLASSSKSVHKSQGGGSRINPSLVSSNLFSIPPKNKKAKEQAKQERLIASEQQGESTSESESSSEGGAQRKRTNKKEQKKEKKEKAKKRKPIEEGGGGSAKRVRSETLVDGFTAAQLAKIDFCALAVILETTPELDDFTGSTTTVKEAKEHFKNLKLTRGDKKKPELFKELLNWIHEHSELVRQQSQEILARKAALETQDDGGVPEASESEGGAGMQTEE